MSTLSLSVSLFHCGVGEGAEKSKTEKRTRRGKKLKKVEIYFLQQCSGLKFGAGRGGVGEMH